MKTRKELTTDTGVTLGQLIEFVAQCSAADMPAATVVQARVTWRARIKVLIIETDDITES